MGGVDKQAKGPKPGILWVNSKITKPDELSPQQYQEWYEKVHIPDIFQSGGIKEASRWETVNSSDDRPYLALYQVEDLDFLQTDEFKGESCGRLW